MYLVQFNLPKLCPPINPNLTASELTCAQCASASALQIHNKPHSARALAENAWYGVCWVRCYAVFVQT